MGRSWQAGAGDPAPAHAYGLLEVRARMEISPRSMAAVWMVGLEEALFDFPDKAASAPPDHVPELAVDYVRETK